MKILKKAEELLFTGKVIKDYGGIDDYQMNLGRFKHSVVLFEKKGQKKIVIMETVTALGGFNKRYFIFDKQTVKKLKDILDDALKTM